MLKGIHAVVAADDELSLVMLSTLLDGQGAHCTTVTNGKLAMKLLEAHPDTIDIVLLDARMPVMDGFDVLAQCKENPYLSDIPVIVLASDHHEKLRALTLGADDFLARPYDSEELELRITKLVRSRRLAQITRLTTYEFLNNATHLLCTPMHQISGLTELLTDAGLGNEEREHVDLIRHATARLSDTMRHIITYVQLGHSTARAIAEPFSLRATVQSALESREIEAAAKGIKLTFTITDSVSDSLNGPGFYVYKVFRFLIENAVKFSPDGDICIAIAEESCGSFGSRFYCSVSDQGIGIPPEFQESIFEPFVRVDTSPTRKHEGSGLGLAIVKRMVELMGGTICVISDGTKGCAFYFSFICNLQCDPEIR